MSQPHIISMLLRDPGTPADREAHARLAAALPDAELEPQRKVEATR
jgi:hypothetical protein